MGKLWYLWKWWPFRLSGWMFHLYRFSFFEEIATLSGWMFHLYRFSFFKEIATLDKWIWRFHRVVVWLLGLSLVIKMIKEHIIDKLKESRGNKICKTADSIKRNVNNESKIWEVKKSVTKRMQWKGNLKTQKERYCKIGMKLSKNMKNIINNF